MPAPIEIFQENMNEVNILMNIHERLTGRQPGRRYGVEVLNKSAIVLITACWESVVEDLAGDGFDFLLEKATSPDKIPMKVRVLASRGLKEDQDETKVWNLAADGWKDVLKDHKEHMLRRFIGTFNTPRAENVDNLFDNLIGLNKVSSSWYWGRITVTEARGKLDSFVTRRGEIAHRVMTARSVAKTTVRDYQNFVYRIAVLTSNRVAGHISRLVGDRPWGIWQYGSVS